MSDQLPLSRRDFLKLSGLGLAGLMAPPLNLNQDPIGPENQKWKDNRFFEKLGDFDSKMFLEIRGQLLEFGERYQDVFQNHQLTQDFSVDVWTEGVKDTMQQLHRISKVYNALKKDNLLDPVSRELLEKDFYETGSIVWIVLRAGELNTPEQMKTGLDEILNFDEIQYINDPIVGSDYSTINTLWSDRLGIANYRSPLIKMFNRGMYEYSNIKWWQKNKGPQALSVYNNDKQNNSRPAEMPIVNSNEHFVDLVEATLKESRLSRVGVSFNTISSLDQWGGAYYVPNNSVEELPREINMFALVNISDAEVEENSIMIQATTVHEGGHALHDLLPFLADDMIVFRHRVKFEKLLRKFDPSSNLDLLFQPSGGFLNENPREQIREKQLEFYRDSYTNLSSSTLTEYMVREYVKEMSIIEQLQYDIERHNNNEEANIFQNLTAAIDNNDAKFSEYWSRLKSDIKKNNLKLNEIEEEIMRRIDQDVERFDADKRMFYLEHEEFSDWRGYLGRIVLPAVLVDAYSKDPQMVMSKILNSISIESEKLPALKSHIDVTLSLLANKSHNSFTMSWVDCGSRRSLTEMFAELVARNYLRRLPEVNDEMPPEIWMEANHVINSMIDDLVVEGLALQNSYGVV